jgi:hypothetical protein
MLFKFNIFFLLSIIWIDQANLLHFISIIYIALVIFKYLLSMAKHTLKNINNNFNTNIYSYLETFGGQSSNLYVNVVHIFNTGVNLTAVEA